SIALEWHDGVFVRKDPPSAMAAASRAHHAEEVFLILLDNAAKQNRRLSISRNSGSYAPRVFANYPKPDSGGFTEKDFRRAMDALLNAGKIENRPYGPPSHASYELRRPSA